MPPTPQSKRGIAQRDSVAVSKITLALRAKGVETLPQCVFPECYGPAVQAQPVPVAESPAYL